MSTAALPQGFFRTASSGDTEEYFLNMGPQHPSTHGVLRLVAKLDGETVKELVPHLGYIHRGIEKMGEHQTYVQYLHLTDRMDYLASHFNNLAHCLMLEKGMGMGVPERAEYLRVMICELQRIQSHLLFWGAFGGDIGAVSAFLYGFKEREIITDIFDEICGSRLTMNYFRPGGCTRDVSDTTIERVRALIPRLYNRLKEFDLLITGNVIVKKRTVGIGVLSPESALSHGCTGPVLRASGVAYDVRRTAPYSIYDRFAFDVPTATEGDCYARYVVRMEEMRQSLRILEQVVRDIPAGPHRCKEAPLYKLPPGLHTMEVETPRGVFAVFAVADKGVVPYRVHNRSPSLHNLSVIDELARGHKLADLIAILATIDIVVPDIDR